MAIQFVHIGASVLGRAAMSAWRLPAHCRNYEGLKSLMVFNTVDMAVNFFLGRYIISKNLKTVHRIIGLNFARVVALASGFAATRLFCKWRIHIVNSIWIGQSGTLAAEVTQTIHYEIFLRFQRKADG